MNPDQRWERLAGELRDAGFADAKVSRRQIMFRSPAGNLVIVRDTWWSKNPDIWTGYQVELAGRNDVTLSLSPRTKRRGEVLAAVRAAAARA